MTIGGAGMVPGENRGLANASLIDRPLDRMHQTFKAERGIHHRAVDKEPRCSFYSAAKAARDVGLYPRRVDAVVQGGLERPEIKL